MRWSLGLFVAPLVLADDLAEILQAARPAVPPQFRNANLRPMKDAPAPPSKSKPTPAPPKYMLFSHHYDDDKCGPKSLVGSHGYRQGTCNYLGNVDSTDLWYSFTTSQTPSEIDLNYNFYMDSSCATTAILSDTETVFNGCEYKQMVNGKKLYKKYETGPKIPPLKGAMVKSYPSTATCETNKDDDVLNYSFVTSGNCNEDGYSFLYGDQDDYRVCSAGVMTVTEWSSADLTCSGTVTDTTVIGSANHCAYGVATGAGFGYLNPQCT